jgi:hypothetical protein
LAEGFVAFEVADVEVGVVVEDKAFHGGEHALPVVFRCMCVCV